MKYCKTSPNIIAGKGECLPLVTVQISIRHSFYLCRGFAPFLNKNLTSVLGLSVREALPTGLQCSTRLLLQLKQRLLSQIAAIDWKFAICRQLDEYLVKLQPQNSESIKLV
ncbi:hypothetical protein [Microcoleus sp. FACHB-68]|uniref:hypothetical protein n=1 Tax=Microcoleus sp. FACHB-68 TaxID=2692826 RepID=UPI001684AAB2|nr:hypothetical protein [Microcoleus sp. FACHB-68]MBD1940446.1 hypothetical protein [Microcoleus sp. FACHB-68]